MSRHLAALLGLALLAGCGGGDTTGPPPPPPSTPVASVTLEPGSVTLVPQQTVQLTATPRAASGSPLSGRPISWTSSNQSIATVSTAGLVTALTPGPATITATSEGKAGTATITVQEAPVASITVEPSGATLVAQQTVQLTARVKDAAGNPLNGHPISWRSSNETIASVSGTGLVTGVAPGGPVSIVATAGGVSGSAQVAVTPPAGPSLVELRSVLDTSEAVFRNQAAQTSGDLGRALALTADWVRTQPQVESAEVIDSTYLEIRLRSGLTTMFYLDSLDANGLSVHRGSHLAPGRPVLTAFRSSANTITNPRVLICAAAASGFYKAGELEAIADRFTTAGLGLMVTVLKDRACNWQSVATFKDYGLVLIDTHGYADGFESGQKLTIQEDSTSTEAAFQAAIDAQAGPGTYARIVSGDLRIGERYTYPGTSTTSAPLWVTSKLVSSLALPGTIVFGNFCYSGYVVPATFGQGPPRLAIGQAFIGTGALSYYGYSFADGRSAGVSNDFSKAMEDSLSYALVVDGDSTEVANLKGNTTEFFDPNIDFRAKTGFGDLFFRHYGAPDWSYPVLKIEKLVPDSAAGGGPAFALTVAGEGFAKGAVVRWNGSGRPTTFFSDSVLRAQIAAGDIAQVGNVEITVANPESGGGRVSKPVTFTVGPAVIGDFDGFSRGKGPSGRACMVIVVRWPAQSIAKSYAVRAYGPDAGGLLGTGFTMGPFTPPFPTTDPLQPCWLGSGDIPPNSLGAGMDNLDGNKMTVPIVAAEVEDKTEAVQQWLISQHDRFRGWKIEVTVSY